VLDLRVLAERSSVQYVGPSVRRARGCSWSYAQCAMHDAIPVFVHLLCAKDLIDRGYAQRLDVAALARMAHASDAHFIRSFKRAFGETPYQYLLSRRVERAMELLRGAELSVTEVALEVGFRSLGSFCTCFRERVGEPPSVYARRWRTVEPPPIPGCFTLMCTRPVESSNFREVPASVRC
jgi:AraC-like DNA-binding protein